MEAVSKPKPVRGHHNEWGKEQHVGQHYQEKRVGEVVSPALFIPPQFLPFSHLNWPKSQQVTAGHSRRSVCDYCLLFPGWSPGFTPSRPADTRIGGETGTKCCAQTQHVFAALKECVTECKKKRKGHPWQLDSRHFSHSATCLEKHRHRWCKRKLQIVE